MRILLIAYSFPPFQDAQALRWYYLSNALVKLGVEIDVITIEHPDDKKDSWYFNKSITIFRIYPGFLEDVALNAKKNIGVDDIRNREIRKSIKFKIMKTLYWGVRNFSGSFLPGDIRTEWFPFAERYIKKNITLNNYDYLITSHEPWVDSLLGLYLKRRSRVKWVADFGDPYVAQYTPRHKLWFENYFERRIYENADLLIFTNEEVIKHLLGKYPFLKNKRLMVVEQGFSYNLCNDIGKKKKGNEVFTLIYTGTFYKDFRNPSNLIKALSMLNFEYKFLLAGKNEQFVKDFEILGDKFNFLGFVDHFNALKFQRNSDVLVHLSNKNPLQVPGKFYEYLGAFKPILCVVYDSTDPVVRLVNELKCGTSCENDPVQIKKSIEVIYKNWKDNENIFKTSCENVYDYSWEKKAEIIYKNLIGA